MKKFSDSDIKTATLLGMLAPIVLIAVYLLGVMYVGWAVWVIWPWFIIPLGIPPIGYWHAVGITLTSFLLTRQGADAKKDNRDTDWGKVFGFLASPIIAVIAAWIIHAWFMG